MKRVERSSRRESVKQICLVNMGHSEHLSDTENVTGDDVKNETVASCFALYLERPK